MRKFFHEKAIRKIQTSGHILLKIACVYTNDRFMFREYHTLHTREHVIHSEEHSPLALGNVITSTNLLETF